MRSIALVISVIFQPLLIPTLVFGLILFGVPEATSIPEEFKYRIFALIALCTLVIPMVTVFGLRFSGRLKTIHMPEIKDRRVPFLITTGYFLFTTWFLFQRTEIDPVLLWAMGVITTSVVVLTIISFFWKMSAHMTGLGGLLAIVMVLGSKYPNFEVLYPLLGTLVLCGVVASSRLFLQAHRPLEIYGGLLVGFLICFIGFMWFGI